MPLNLPALVYIKTVYPCDSINVYWTIKADEYKKEGNFHIPVEPQLISNQHTIEFDPGEPLKEDKETIEDYFEIITH